MNDVTVPIWIAGIVLGALISVIGYFIRLTTLDAINQLRQSAEKQGKRLGKLDKEVGILLHEAEKEGRVRRKTLAAIDKDEDDDSDGGGIVQR